MVVLQKRLLHMLGTLWLIDGLSDSRLHRIGRRHADGQRRTHTLAVCSVRGDQFCHLVGSAELWHDLHRNSDRFQFGITADHDGHGLLATHASPGGGAHRFRPDEEADVAIMPQQDFSKERLWLSAEQP